MNRGEHIFYDDLGLLLTAAALSGSWAFSIVCNSRAGPSSAAGAHRLFSREVADGACARDACSARVRAAWGVRP